MQITRAADYAVRVMIHLATLPPADRAQLDTLVDATGVAACFLSKVVQRLVHAGFVSSHRGTGGGFCLRVSSDQVTLLEVIEAIEGPTRLNICLGTRLGCDRQSWCGVHPVWQQAQTALTQVLAGVTISQLAEETRVNLAKLDPALK